MQSAGNERDGWEAQVACEPFFDAHTHIDAAHLSARGLDDVLLYHMSISDLYAAGCPSGARLPEDRSEAEAESRLTEAIPYLDYTRNTWIAWGVRIILSDLYDWHDPITPSNWQGLHACIQQRAQDPAWPREIAKRAGIARICTEWWRGREGQADDLLQYSLEWAFFSRTQWGQPDIPLYELERAWNSVEAGRPIPGNFNRATAPPLAKIIHTPEDVKEAVAHYCNLMPYGKVLSTATHLATDIDYSDPDDAAMARAIARRAQASDADRDIYASYITHAFLRELEQHGDEMVFQFSLGAEALPFETSSRLYQRTLGQLAAIVARYPRLRFACYLSSRHGNQSLCTLARELPNLYVAGYWWHNFFAGPIRQVMEERLDMLPMNKQIGFFSDAYCLDWAYAKAVMVRRLWVEVLREKVALGQYNEADCTAITRGVMFDSSRDAMGMIPGAAWKI